MKKNITGSRKKIEKENNLKRELSNISTGTILDVSQFNIFDFELASDEEIENISESDIVKDLRKIKTKNNEMVKKMSDLISDSNSVLSELGEQEKIPKKKVIKNKKISQDTLLNSSDDNIIKKANRKNRKKNILSSGVNKVVKNKKNPKNPLLNSLDDNIIIKNINENTDNQKIYVSPIDVTKVTMLETTSTKPITTLIHMADIHIKNCLDNVDELNIVSSRLYNYIESLGSQLEETLIVVCGDIFHNKTTMTTESVPLVKNFFIKLTSFTNCVVIPGNHDINMNNYDVPDAISAVMDNVNTKHKLLLLKHSGVYCYNNILFGVTDLFSCNVTQINDQHFVNLDKNIKYTKVGLYHGIIKNAKLDNDYVMTQDTQEVINEKHFKKNIKLFNENDFSCYDMTLLGDIHLLQFIGEAKRIAYSSSLIQQSFKEKDIYGHGIILWNVEKREGLFQRIVNDYCYLTITMEGNKVVNPYAGQEIPKNVRLRIKYGNTTMEDRQKTIEDYKKKYNIVSVVEVNDINFLSKQFENHTFQDKILSEIKDNTNAKKMLMEYIDEKMNGDENRKKTIKTNLEILFSKVTTNVSNIKNIKLVDIKFSNLFVYGLDNYINFEKVQGVTGLCGPNTYGKTSIIDIICLSIYGTNPRNLNSFDVLKYGEKQYRTEIIFKVNDIKYKIIRIGKKSPDKNKDIFTGNVREEVYFYMYDNNNIEKNITRDEKNKTEKIIKSICGEFSDFQSTSILLSTHNDSFVTKTNTNKKKFLEKIFGLDVLNHILNEVKAKVTILKHDSKAINTKLNGNDIKTIENEITNKEKLLENTTNRIKQMSCKKDLLYNEINKIINNIDNYDKKKINNEELSNYKHSKEVYENKKKELKIVISTISEISDKIELLTKKKEDVSQNLNKIDIVDNLKNEILDLQKINMEITSEKKQIFKSVHDIDKLNKQKKDFDLRIKTIHEKLDNYINQKDKIKLSKIMKYNSSTVNIIEKYINYISQEELIRTTIEKMLKMEDEHNISLTKLKKHKYNINCKECMQNPQTQQILFYETEINKNKISIKENEMKLVDINIFLKTHETKYNNHIINEKNKNDNELKIKERNVLTTNIDNENKLKDIYSMKIEDTNIMIDKYKENIEFLKFNDKIDVRYNKNNLSISNLQKKIDMIEKNKEEINNINEKINNLTVKMIDHQKKEFEINNNINLWKANETKYSELIEETIEFNKNKELLSKKENEIKSLNNELIIENNNRDEHLLIVSKKQHEKKIFGELSETQSKINKELEIYEDITKILGKGGIISEILQFKILPLLEKLINNILINVEVYTIKFMYVNDNISIYKVYNDKYTNIQANSGHESGLDNVIFCVIFNIVSNCVKTNFFIIDEGFKMSDENKKNNLGSLFEQLKLIFNFVMVITHDNYIKNNFTNIIEINRANDVSHINYV